MCEYEFRNGERCKEEALPNSKYCILHIDLPEDEESDEFKRINELKEEKVKEKISKEDFNFEGAKLSKVDFSEMSIEVSLAFDYAVIRNGAWFNGAEICGDASFYEAKIGGKAAFVGAKIGGAALFSLTEIKGVCSFKDATFEISKAQEEACRTARRTQERIGDRVSADYHFYREIEAKRKQKNPVIRFVELPVQYIFGYGVYPWRVIAT